MALIRYNNDLWQDSFTGLDEMFQRMLGARASSPLLYGDGESHSLGFRADLFADANGYKVIAELPGIPKGNIDISLENTVLTITAERSEGEGDDARSVTLTRSISLHEDVDPDKVAATLKDGLLAVDLPKREERKPRSIKIKG